MDFHDAYARTTPLELAFPEAAAARAAVERIADEAEVRGADTGELGAFAMLVSVNSVLRELGGVEASRDAIVQHASLLFHVYHFVRGEGRLYLVSADAARSLVGPTTSAPSATAALPPAAAGYVQLPRHLFWVQPDPSAPAEAVDGFFWTWTASTLRLLLAAGMRESRPGLTVIPLPEAPVEEAGAWPSARCRPDGDDFANTLPGGETDGLLAFTTAGEAFKLAGRLFAYMERTPDALLPGAGDRSAGPAPSRLPFVRIVAPTRQGADG